MSGKELEVYNVEVIERHSDIVRVQARSIREAVDIAISEANCRFKCLYDVKVFGEEYMTDDDEFGPNRRDVCQHCGKPLKTDEICWCVEGD